MWRSVGTMPRCHARQARHTDFAKHRSTLRLSMQINTWYLQEELAHASYSSSTHLTGRLPCLRPGDSAIHLPAHTKSPDSCASKP
jgi:hypothetical protein